MVLTVGQLFPQVPELSASRRAICWTRPGRGWLWDAGRVGSVTFKASAQVAGTRASPMRASLRRHRMALVSVHAHSVEAASRQLPGRGLAACVQAMGEARTAAATTKQRSMEVFIAALATMQSRSVNRALVMMEGRPSFMRVNGLL